MTHTAKKNSVKVFAGEYVDEDGNVSEDGSLVMGTIDITSYDAPEVITSGDLQLAAVDSVVFHLAQGSEHELHAAVVAADNRSVSLTIDDVGTGTEAGADDVGEVHFIAAGRRQGSGTNS